MAQYKDYSGAIQRVIERRVTEQGNSYNPDLPHIANKRQGGMTWQDTPEGDIFWSDVLTKLYFYVFYKKYPQGVSTNCPTMVSEGDTFTVTNHIGYTLAQTTILEEFAPIGTKVIVKTVHPNGISCEIDTKHNFFFKWSSVFPVDYQQFKKYFSVHEFSTTPIATYKEDDPTEPVCDYTEIHKIGDLFNRKLIQAPRIYRLIQLDKNQPVLQNIESKRLIKAFWKDLTYINSTHEEVNTRYSGSITIIVPSITPTVTISDPPGGIVVSGTTEKILLGS